jgi:hypothetical protein
MSVLSVERNDERRFSSFAGQQVEHHALAAVAVGFEIRDHDGAGVLFPLIFKAVEDVRAVRRDRVEVAVARDRGVQLVLDGADDEIAPREPAEPFALGEAIEQPIVVVDLVFGLGLDDRFPVRRDALPNIGICHAGLLRYFQRRAGS